MIHREQNTHFVSTLEKVLKRIENGIEESLRYYFSEAIPDILTYQGSDGTVHLQKQPWWKFW